tara:strand:+ start:25083 stop:25721 length:639 start_codon:yes stop_codon:yes gene_type:complete
MQSHPTDSTRSTEKPPTDPTRHVGRPRDERAHRLILEATTALVLERGFDGLTIEGVARRAGVAKTTIYRWWKNKVDLLAETCAQDLSRAPLDPTESLQGDLVGLLRQELAVQASPMAHKVLPGLMARMAEDDALRKAFESRFPIAPGACTHKTLERARVRDEVDGTDDAALLREMIAGVVFWRLHVCHLETSETDLQRIAQVLRTGLERESS